MDIQINRRQFITRASAALAGLAAPAVVYAAQPHAAQPKAQAQLSHVPQFRVPLPIPKVLSPAPSHSTTDYYELSQDEAWTEIIPGVRTRIWGYNGTFPGPTIKARRGRRSVVTHTNRLGVPSVVHLHGGITRPESDGFPTDLVVPGEKR